ncbi:hypothetical protein AV656_08120 [Bhargavaea cecembensis]|uniref:Knr4/Smi1-like domain-containing protein n=1 Tax=Bhargavaea cecembensis TaxID=394098 RepID=A0A163FKE3_9BACL|nr:SMI1/KNR4 family protein [Bhargavaea cecembensis]KZE38857.1 hypothetical protein AV656_08120 [Bhargavaea cecembensis]
MKLEELQELQELIEEHADTTDFTGGISESKIGEIEKALAATLPTSYKWFLRNYGSGGIYGVDILGAGKLPIPNVVTNTERLRKTDNLPTKFVVVEDVDEFYYCLDTTELVDDECPVVAWDRAAGFSGKRADHFGEFLENSFMDAKEEWEQ